MSTYSPDLRITLITTGDQAGTWGTTTNTNLGTIIEDAISGYTTVSVTSANQAFTALDGTADQARNAMIRLATTTTAAFSVYAPPNSKQYIIWNNSGYTATIYNSTIIGNTTAAGTGISVADGKKVVVFSDGTNFYTIDAANLTGTLAIANGGTGQVTANAAFNALAPSQASASGKYLKSDGTNTSWDAIDLSTADITGALPVANGGTGVTTSTGSGSRVLSTSPTLVTPVLGTPTSVTLTNATGLPLATGVTGTLPVANGGTGVTTSTGTGAVVLSNSPTLVTPALGTPASGTLTNATGLPLTTGVTGTLPIANGGTGITALGTGVQTALGQNVTGSGGMVLATSPSISSPTLVTPALGTPTSGTLTNATGLPIDGGTTGTLPVARGGTGVTTSTGSGSTVLSNSPTLVTPALGTPSSGNLANCTFPTLNQNTTGNAATATSPQSGGSFITSSNIGSQSVSYATSAGSASSATNATNATNASYATTQSQGNNSTLIATTAYVQNMGAGLSQTWTNYASGGARSVNSSFTWGSLSSIYTNSTGKPIMVGVGRFGGNGYATTVWVDAVEVLKATVDQYGGAESMGAVLVQPGSQYAVSVSGGVWCNYWVELR